jgi:hypothetical protein
MVEMTLVKSLHSGDPDAMGMLAQENMLCYWDYIRVKSMCLQMKTCTGGDM